MLLYSLNILLFNVIYVLMNLQWLLGSQHINFIEILDETSCNSANKTISDVIRNKIQ
jgi:hypothetical protein